MAQLLVVAQLLPDDILACVLHRLAPRSLAASRCVCKRWCAVIDDRHLLRTDLLPLSLYGVFFMEELDPPPPKFIANPMTRRKIAAADFGYVEGPLSIKDHCNGLLLLWDLVVVDPATRQCARLPPPPPMRAGMDFDEQICLAFDPTVSPHYEVLLFHDVPMVLENNTTIFTKESEWPPSPYTMHVFSSKTWRWEERLLARRGEPPGTIADMQSDRRCGRRYVVYWKGSVYVHCQNDFILRINLADGVYEMIKPPTGSETGTCPRLYLGKSKKGVYCALIYHNNKRQLQVWLLTELCGKMKWVLKVDTGLVSLVAKYFLVSFGYDEDINTGPWILHEEGDCDEGGTEAPVEDNTDWDFGNGFILENEDVVEDFGGSIYFLGFHPYKEIVFLWVAQARVVAYDFSSLKVQDLGRLLMQSIGDSFPYTPCWIGELFEKNWLYN